MLRPNWLKSTGPLESCRRFAKWLVIVYCESGNQPRAGKTDAFRWPAHNRLASRTFSKMPLLSAGRRIFRSRGSRGDRILAKFPSDGAVLLRFKLPNLGKLFLRGGAVSQRLVYMTQPEMSIRLLGVQFHPSLQSGKSF